MSEALEPGRGGFNSSHREMNETQWPVSPETVFRQTESLLGSILQKEADAWLRPRRENEAAFLNDENSAEAMPADVEELPEEARKARFEQFTQAALVTGGALRRTMQTMEYQFAASSIEEGELPGPDGVDLLRRMEMYSRLEQAFSQEAAFYAPEDDPWDA